MKAGQLFEKLRDALQEGGLFGFLVKVLRHLRRAIIARGKFLIFEHSLDDPSFASSVTNATLKVFRTMDEITILSTAGYDVTNLDLERTRRLFSKGALLFCVFVDQELAHRSWVSLSGKADIDPIAPKVKYHDCAYIGDCFTWASYRGLGLYPYVLTEICQALKTLGLTHAYLTVAPDNVASISGVTKAGFRRCGKGHLVRILWISSWGISQR